MILSKLVLVVFVLLPAPLVSVIPCDDAQPLRIDVIAITAAVTKEQPLKVGIIVCNPPTSLMCCASQL